MSECCSYEDTNIAGCAEYADTSKKRKYTPIEWRSVSSKPTIPPPPFDKNAKDEEIVLTNYTILKKIMKYSNESYDHYEYSVEKLGDLLSLCDYFHQRFEHGKLSNINLYAIDRISPHIYELDKMIGMEAVKKQVLSLVLFFLQSLDDANQDMLHSVIYGAPGVGKTRLINILANIFASLGVTETAKVTFVKRADLVGQYLGQTAVKTKKVLDDARGGVLVIDEAYSLGDTEQRDSFSRESIDTINQYLSECKRDLICIIAGYREDLEKRFFKTNAGLKRRFAFHYEIPDYSASQLREIFVQNVKNHGWELSDNAAPPGFFEENLFHFEHNGGDMELLFAKAKYEHARRVFSGFLHERKILTREDMEAGLAKFMESNGRKEKDDAPPPMMYT